MSTNKKKLLIGITLSLVSLLLIINLSQRYLFSSDNTYEQIKRFWDVYKIVASTYVEEVDGSKLVTGAIQGMLEELDPHSVYIEPAKVKEINEQFEGSYEGIGIEFIIQDKILTVVAPIAGSPSEALGLRPGDQIVKIEGKSAYGITEQEVQKRLKGPKGSKVTVTIKRPGFDEPFDIILNDVNKYQYPEIADIAIPHLRSGGMLITDNALWGARVVDPNVNDEDTEGVRDYNRIVYDRTDIFTTIIPLRDGLAVSVKY